MSDDDFIASLPMPPIVGDRVRVRGTSEAGEILDLDPRLGALVDQGDGFGRWRRLSEIERESTMQGHYNVRSELPDGARARAAGRSLRLNGNRVSAAVIWVAGVASTWLGVKAFLVGAPFWLPILSAVIAQFVLTFAERAVWRGRPSGAGLAALAIDVALNAGGLFPYALKLGETPPAQMVITVFGGSRQVTPLSAMIAAIIVGFLIAAAPEDLWSRRD